MTQRESLKALRKANWWWMGNANRGSVESIERAVYVKELVGVVEAALQTITEREADVIRKRFGIGGEEPCTLREIGQRYGVQAERIRQNEAKALCKLRHPSRVYR